MDRIISNEKASAEKKTKTKGQPTEWEMIFANNVVKKG